MLFMCVRYVQRLDVIMRQCIRVFEMYRLQIGLTGHYHEFAFKSLLAVYRVSVVDVSRNDSVLGQVCGLYNNIVDNNE